jgi:hypothetical protein
MPPNVPHYLTTKLGTWKLQPEPLGGWMLKWLTTISWVPVDRFGTIEEAIDAVARGRTGIHHWDSLSHNPAEFALEMWVADTKGTWPE